MGYLPFSSLRSDFQSVKRKHHCAYAPYSRATDDGSCMGILVWKTPMTALVFELK